MFGGCRWWSAVRFSRSVQRCGQTELRPAQKMSLAGSVAGGGGARSVEGAVAAMLDIL